MKPLVALYKCYRGGEWFAASLESVRPHCAGVVAVTSDAPWRGVPGERHLPENCREPLARFKARHPDLPVLTVRPGGRQSTEEQYRAGLSLIASRFPGHGVLVVDTDEVWEDADLLALREAMAADARALYFRSGIWTYLRSPLYRVFPQERARVVVGLANPSLPTGRSRFAGVRRLAAADQIRDVDCDFHHYGYVRLDHEEIVSKLACSISQDGVPCVPDWKRAVWDRLPAGRNIHPQRGFEHCWGGVEELPPAGLPPAAPRSDAFWAGLAWHSGDRPHALFTAGDPAWRAEAEAMLPADCPATTVPQGAGPALAPLAGVLGLDWLTPRLRMSLRETIQLAALATLVPVGGRALEVGSGLGGSMAVMMMACGQSVSLTAVDPYLPYDEENVVLDRNVREGSAETLAETVRMASAVAGTVRVELDRSSSADAARRATPASLDLLLIDGNHSYASCKEDLELWWPAVKSGGLLLVHDYATRFPGVVRAVKEFEAGRGVTFLLPLRSTLAWLRKA